MAEEEDLLLRLNLVVLVEVALAGLPQLPLAVMEIHPQHHQAKAITVALEIRLVLCLVVAVVELAVLVKLGQQQKVGMEVLVLRLFLAALLYFILVEAVVGRMRLREELEVQAAEVMEEL